jgi:hypothetical protein
MLDYFAQNQIQLRLMKNYLLFLLLLPAYSFAQTRGDSRIIVTLKNQDSITHKVKNAFIKNNFIVKDNGYKTIISTYPKEFKNVPGYSMAKAEINGNTITLSGMYDIKKSDDLNFNRDPKEYKPIIFYKGSYGWKLLMEIVKQMDGQISFSK